MTKRIVFSVLGVFASLLLTGCQSGPTAKDEPVGGLPLVEGTWKFSHLGSPTIWNSEMPDPGKIIKAQFKTAKFVFDRSGNASMTMVGQARSVQFEVDEETDAFLKLRISEGGSDQKPWIYDKTDRSLMMPTNLEVQGSTGVIPTYFRRRW
ncbi:MAG: hypothetical protein AAF514_15315 [Verrucomicrobiota bacterium]